MMNFIDSISPNYTETDFSQHPAITVQGRQNDPDVKWLVIYNTTKGEILVDKRAPEWYKKLAAFHVEVCREHQHEALIPDLTTDRKRCSMVEEYIAGQLSDDPIWDEYATARKKMLGFLLDTGLASPDQKESLLVTLQGLL